jgi:hypothetical protein
MTDPFSGLPYVTSMQEIFWGVVLVALSLAIHAFGMVSTLQFTAAFKRRFEPTPTFARGVASLLVATWIIIAVHLSEVLMWAAFFQWKDCFPNLSTAVYFSLNQYTTVGSALTLPTDWRLLSGMIATAGLLGFAWSCGVLLTLAQTFQDNQLKMLQARRAKHDH